MRAREVLEPMLAEVAHLESVVEKRACRFGDEDLPAVPGCHHARTLMDGQTHVAPVGRCRLTGVQAHPHADLVVIGPGMSGEGLLGVGRRLDRALSGGKGDEEGVAFGVDLYTVVGRECRA